MLYWLANQLTEYVRLFSVFDYITFRVILSVLTSLVMALALGPYLIHLLAKRRIEEHIRDNGPASHQDKSGTPTMGGVLIVVAVLITTLLWGDLSNQYIWLCLFCITSYAVLGWYDDYLKMAYANSKGLSVRMKLLVQMLLGFALSCYIYFSATTEAELIYIIPVFKNITFDLGWFFILFSMVVIVGSSNAVNLTDGLDGLAIMPTVLICVALAAVAYMTGNVNYAAYLSIPYIRDVGEIAIFLSAIVGSGLGFLWFNTYPAQIFMGDMGALSLGAVLGIVSILIRQEFLLLIMGGVFVMETLSVILQVASFKLVGKRMFRMAPLHHHFELKGWPEPKVIVRFWIITVVLVLVGLATLKIR